MKINLLSSEVYTQIAAGEVVESPRSIVKELVENSIDAGATAITIYIEDGGLKSITVADNGIGIENSQVEKAFLPHATSKISTVKDLLSISTLGFRGEALASIAAVSEVTLNTRYKDDNLGTKLVIKGGEVLEKAPSSIEKGSNINVTNLFYNTPARFKFLKSAKTEENNITATVQGLILANPDVSFTYYIDDKIKYFNAEIGLSAAVETVFGDDFYNNCLEINEKVEDIKVNGYISQPALVRGNRSGQFLIINGRVVTDTTISAVVQNAYGTRLMTRTFPIYCLAVTMPAEDVDVNVHPNKTEVRLSAPKRLSGIIYHSVQKALDEYDKNKFSSLLASNILPAKDDVIDIMVNNKNTKSYNNILGITPPKEIVEQQSFDFGEIRRILDKDTSRPQNAFAERAEFIYPENKINENNIQKVFDNFRVVGQIFNTYLIIESGMDIYIIDQHAAHEKIRYDKLIKELDNDNVQSQLLLLPHTMYLDGQDLIVLEKNKERLKDFGFDLKIDEEKVVICAIPMVLSELNLNVIIHNIIAELKEIDDFRLSKILKEKLASKACKGAIKGGEQLNTQQIAMFIEYYKNNGKPLQCPHGRPAIIKLGEKDLEKLFKRIV